MGNASIAGLFVLIKVPHVTVVEGAGRDAFGGIDRASAAQPQDETDLMFFTDLDAFPHLIYARIGVHTRDLEYFLAGLRQLHLHAIVPSVLPDAGSTRHQQNRLVKMKKFFG
jgi:hypothetical protein